MAAMLENDVALVARSVRGDRPAFAQIVARYQSLVCSVAYSATGSLSRSEDLAQETFLAAWRNLGDLREPARLRAWLCGIARNLALNHRRSEGQEPAHDALPIDVIAEAPQTGPSVDEVAIRDEEQAILWRSIERIPATYREALVLFYREHQSVENVARSLELSEDVVRQRLSRGRKLLQAEVLSFVEGALERSAPGKAFTATVVAALPALAVSSKASAAVAGLSAAHGTALAKSGFLGLLLGLFGPVVGAINIWIGVRTGLEAAPTARERALVLRQAAVLIGGSVAFSIALLLLVQFGPRLGDHAGVLLALGVLLSFGFAGWIAYMTVRYLREAREMRAATGGAPTHFREFRSATTLAGWPLCHVRYGTPPVDAPPVRGWIAVGDRAIGLLFAMGNVSCGLVSVGVVASGGLCVGGVAFGVLPMAAASFGVLALGGAAFGALTIGGFSAGWTGAVGGLAMARDYAAGGWAIAAHANDAVARQWLGAWLPPSLFYTLLGLIAFLSIVPTLVLASRQRRHFQTPQE
jgi:RNA polymerase sigma factor (sigma-70 family)